MPKQNSPSSTTGFRFGLAGIIAVIMLVFVGWPQYQELVEKYDKLSELKKQITTTETKLEAERTNYRLLKNEYGDRAGSDKVAIAKIFPTEAEQTNITRELELYTNSLNTPTNPFFLKSINFGNAVNKKDTDYLSLPFKIIVNTNKENLIRLLRYFESSGTITVDSSSARRLLDIQSIDIQFSDTGSYDAGNGNIDVNLALNAYIAPKTETK